MLQCHPEILSEISSTGFPENSFENSYSLLEIPREFCQILVRKFLLQKLFKKKSKIIFRKICLKIPLNSCWKCCENSACFLPVHSRIFPRVSAKIIPGIYVSVILAEFSSIYFQEYLRELLGNFPRNCTWDFFRIFA